MAAMMNEAVVATVCAAGAIIGIILGIIFIVMICRNGGVNDRTFYTSLHTMDSWEQERRHDEMLSEMRKPTYTPPRHHESEVDKFFDKYF